jgi:hypothetical protein
MRVIRLFISNVYVFCVSFISIVNIYPSAMESNSDLFRLASGFWTLASPATAGLV